jgi:hypothetical protein
VPDKLWLTVTERAGFAAAQRLLEAMVAGSIDPKDGHVLLL